jgi:cbb3-type cytochrome c oxidase subunit III
MKSRHLTAALLGLSSLAVIAMTPAQAADINAGQAKSPVCAGCHGTDANSVSGNFPRLAGQHAKYLEKQLHDFKSGKRKDATMNAMVAPLSDEDIANLAAYFAAQKPNGNAKFDPSLLQKGQDIYRGGITETGTAACTGCHSPDGKGNGPAGFPRLAGQHPEYVFKQLKDFQHGTRGNDPGQMMRGLTQRMQETEMKAVAAYIAAMK